MADYFDVCEGKYGMFWLKWTGILRGNKYPFNFV